MNEKCAINIYSKFAYLAKCLCCMQIAHTPRVSVARVCVKYLCVCRQPASGTLAIGWRPKRLSRLKSFQSGYQSIRSSSQQQQPTSRAASECNKLLRFTAHTSQVATGNGSRGSGSPTWATVVASCCKLHYPLAIVHCT